MFNYVGNVNDVVNDQLELISSSVIRLCGCIFKVHTISVGANLNTFAVLYGCNVQRTIWLHY